MVREVTDFAESRVNSLLRGIVENILVVRPPKPASWICEYLRGKGTAGGALLDQKDEDIERLQAQLQESQARVAELEGILDQLANALPQLSEAEELQALVVDGGLELEGSATKIQAQFRGRQSRASSAARQQQEREMNEAAIKMQAIQRGRASRRARATVSEVDGDGDGVLTADEILGANISDENKESLLVVLDEAEAAGEELTAEDAEAVMAELQTMVAEGGQELVDSAAALQSLYRGRRERRERAEQQGAATKMQAIHRGRQSRRAAAAVDAVDTYGDGIIDANQVLDADISDDQKDALLGLVEAADAEGVELTAEDAEAVMAELEKLLEEGGEELVGSATKIQSLYRGRQQRAAAAEALKEQVAKWGQSTFEQFDGNKDGSLSKKELSRALKCLPKRKPRNVPEGTKFMSVDEMIDAMDADGDGSVDLNEWLVLLSECAGLAATLAENVNSKGELDGYRSLDDQLAKRQGEVAALEAKAGRSEVEEAKLIKYKANVLSILAKLDEAAANKAMTEELSGAEVEGAATSVQAQYRGYQARKQRAAEVAEENDAATKMQAMQRGRMQRKAMAVTAAVDADGDGIITADEIASAAGVSEAEREVLAQVQAVAAEAGEELTTEDATSLLSDLDAMVEEGGAELVDKATAIQSLYRGRKSRQQAGMDAKENEAATKVQAIQRGRMQRRAKATVDAVDADGDGVVAADEIAAADVSEAERDALTETSAVAAAAGEQLTTEDATAVLSDLDAMIAEGGAELVDKATAIQSLYRGRQSRQAAAK